MAWDDVKATGNEITADEWNAHVIDQKSRGFDSIEVFEADGTFDASSIDTVFVEGIGGGGGGGGTNNSSTYERGAGGGGGGYVAAYIDLSAVDSVPISVGSGGSVGDGIDGSPGGDSTFGSYLTAFGGEGGPVSSTQAAIGGEGGIGTINTGSGFTSPGGVGGGAVTSSSVPTIGTTSAGGDSVYGVGGHITALDVPSFDGRDGVKYGGGGGGAISNIGSSFQGGVGAQGAVIVHYIS